MPKANTEDILVSGLLQNLGQLIMACTLPEEYEKVLLEAGEDSVDSRSAEKSVLGVDHCFIGAEVAKYWKFPPSIYLPILYHHEPSGS